jgi:hypothetical protein
MAITKLSSGSSFTNLQKYDSFLAGNSAYIPGDFVSIASTTGTGSSGTITFSSIPSTYKNLQIRVNIRTDVAATSSSVLLYANGDTGANYIRHNLTGNGVTVTAGASAAPASSVFTIFRATGSTAAANATGVGVLDIIDYASTTKNKVFKAVTGNEDNTTAGQIILYSGAWLSTSAINSITLYLSSGNFTTQSTFSLYGIQG